MDEIRSIAREHGALIIEDAAESLGASYHGEQTGMFGDYGVISFNGNKIITGSSAGGKVNLPPPRKKVLDICSSS